MKLLNMLDYYPCVNKSFTNYEDIKKLMNNDFRQMCTIIIELIKDCNKNNIKYYMTNNNIYIPSTVVSNYFNLNVKNLKKYHDSLDEFF